jgi:hypothetical protein
MSLLCCGASKNVVANQGFQAHSEFNRIKRMNEEISLCAPPIASAFSTLRATGGYL